MADSLEYVNSDASKFGQILKFPVLSRAVNNGNSKAGYFDYLQYQFKEDNKFHYLGTRDGNNGEIYQ